MTAVQASHREERLMEDVKGALESKNYSVDVPTTHTLRELLMLSSVDMETSDSTSITALCTIDADPSEALHSFEKLLSFTREKGHAHKAEVCHILFPVFVHFYLDLLAASHTDAALAFFSKHKDCLGSGHSSELKELSELSTPSQLPTSSLVAKFRKQKFCVRMSSIAFQLLAQFLQVCSTPILYNLIQRYLTIEVYGSAPLTGGDSKKTSLSPSFTKPSLPPQLSLDKTRNKPRRSSSSSKFTLASGTVATDDSKSHSLHRSQSVSIPPSNATPQAELTDFKERLHAAAGASQLTPTPPSISVHTIESIHPHAYCATFNSNKSLFCYGFSNSSLCLWPELPSTTDHMTSHDHHAHTSTTAEQETASRGQPPFASLLGHRGAVYGACFNSRGQYLLSSSEDCSVRMWDVDKRSCVVCYRGHQYPVWNVVFSPVDVYFASCSHDTTARLWSADLVYPLRIFAGHTASVNVAQFHPNGKYVATGSSDHTCRLWDIHSGQCVRLLAGKKGSIHSLVFLPNGKQIVTSGQDGTVHIWDLGSGSVVREFRGHTSALSAICCSSDGTLLATAGYDKSLRVWNLSSAGAVDSELISTVSIPNSLALGLQFTHRNCLKALTSRTHDQKTQPQCQSSTIT